MNKEIQIIKSDKNTYSIFFNKYSEPLIKSIAIQGATITDNYKTLTFKASSVEKFKSSQITYESAIIILINISDQLKYLAKEYKKGFLVLNPENIFIINESKYIYLSNEYLFDFYNTKNIFITYPFSLNNKFISPEAREINNLPSQIHYKTIYYSLACLIIYFFSESENIESESENIENIKKIKGTKLFFLLKRMLIKEAEKRSIVFI
jgi:hypothetical protein